MTLGEQYSEAIKLLQNSENLSNLLNDITGLVQRFESPNLTLYHLLKLKILRPYFISHQTILHFSDFEEGRQFSFDDVLQIFVRGNHVQSKFYFKTGAPSR